MASLGGGLAGAAGGFAAGGPIGAALGGLAGLFGGSQKQRLTAEQRAALAQQRAIANQLYGFAQSAPMTSPDELAALAQDRGILGQQQRGTLAGIYADLNPAQGQIGRQDMANTLAAGLQGQQMQLQEQHMLDALARRRQALLEAANVNESVAGMAPGYVPNPLGEQLGQLAQVVAYQRALKQGQQQRQPAAPKGGTTPETTLQMPGALNGVGASPARIGNPFGLTVGAPATPSSPGLQLPARMGGVGPGDDPVVTAILTALVQHLARRKKPRRKRAGVGDAMSMAVPGMMSAPVPGMMPPAPEQPGAAAPGNAPGDVNTILNQIRQAGLQTRLQRLPGGMRAPY